MKWRIPWRLVSWLTVTALLFAWSAFLRQRDETGIPSERFWFQKLKWQGCADCILTGDSRMVVSVPPAPISEELPGLRVLNAAYFGAAYTPAYIENITTVLDPQSRDRSIVLAITPRSFTRIAARNSDFELRHKNQLRKRVIGEIRWLFKRIPLHRLLADLLPVRPISRDFRHFCEDGWVAMYVVNIAPLDALPHYVELFSTEKIVHEWIDGLLAAVQQWSAAGIRVYALRPPSTAEMCELENRLSTFDEQDFVRRFKEAGGVWLDVDQTGYPSFDGSHLPWPAALEFSRDLGRAIAAARATGAPEVRAERTLLDHLPPRWYAYMPARYHRYYDEWAREHAGGSTTTGPAAVRATPAGN